MSETYETGPQTSVWAMGWAALAAVLMLIAGIWGVIVGIAGIAQDDLIVATDDWTLQLSITTWGWIHLIVGIVFILSGIGIFTGNVLARTVGVIVAGIGAIVNFAWMPYYPVWSIVLIAVDVAVIWALTAHGRDLSST